MTDIDGNVRAANAMFPVWGASLRDGPANVVVVQAAIPCGVSVPLRGWPPGGPRRLAVAFGAGSVLRRLTRLSGTPVRSCHTPCLLCLS